mmetsp:Transcript_83575/g.227068  ORF Transcript_83575/g.227068 Transcript_83575/m.227068 type:complete len:263 (-) Transcript_83575:195-983(-)
MCSPTFAFQSSQHGQSLSEPELASHALVGAAHAVLQDGEDAPKQLTLSVSHHLALADPTSPSRLTLTGIQLAAPLLLFFSICAEAECQLVRPLLGATLDNLRAGSLFKSLPMVDVLGGMEEKSESVAGAPRNSMTAVPDAARVEQAMASFRPDCIAQWFNPSSTMLVLRWAVQGHSEGQEAEILMHGCAYGPNCAICTVLEHRCLIQAQVGTRLLPFGKSRLDGRIQSAADGLREPRQGGWQRVHADPVGHRSLAVFRCVRK